MTEAGEAMHRLVAELYPICRSITGDGIRETLRRLTRYVPLALHEVPSGTRVFDWTVPREWNIRDAWVKDPRGERVIDFRRSNLHVVSYSVPVRATLSLAELRPHLFTLPEQPDLVPYRTSYYEEQWGFCLAQRTLDALGPGPYDVCIDSTLADGHLTYGECAIGGDGGATEVLVSCHACHPSLANDNLSGLAVAAFLGRALAERQALRHRYRFLFIPGTIGSITWLARNEALASRIAHGFVLTCVGDPGPATYKRSRRGDAAVDRAFAHVLQRSGAGHAIVDFFPYGYDERQYCSPGFDLPIGCLMRTPHGRFPEYHTSADDPQFVRAEALADSLATCLAVVDLLEHDRRYQNLLPKCEPQLGRRGLYDAIGGRPDVKQLQLALLWVLNQSDGRHSLLDIAEAAGLDFSLVRDAARTLEEHGLLRAVADEPRA